MAFIDLSDAVPSTPPSGFVDLSEEMKPPKPEGLLNTVGRGVKESFQQLPQLGYGVGAGVAAAGETAFGEGGIFTAAKQAAIKGYTDWSDKIAAHARENDSIDTAWDKAKEGDVGALVDWLAHGIGYTGGQALQVLGTGGLGYAAGKLTAEGAAKALASGMIKKEAERIGESAIGKEIVTKVGATAAADEIARLATANVAGKIGQTAALGVNAFGMEAGEIFGDLTQKNKERPLTGEELGRAFGASVAAGGLEFIGDKLELSALTGKGVGKGILGRAGRAAAGAVAIAPAEGATEYGQTLLEEYGKGNEDTINPFSVSDATQKQARESAALGALGGAVVGGAGGALSPSPKQKPPAPNPVITDAPDVDSAIAAFKFTVADPTAAGERLAAARLTYKDQTPEEIASNQETLVKALQTTSGFALDDTGAPTLNGAPIKAVAAQELPAHGETEGLSRDAYEAIAALNAAQGKKTVVFEDNESIPMEGFVNDTVNQDTVFVSNKSKVDPAVVAAHEAQHLLDGPQFEGFANIINEELTERATAVARERHGADMSDATLAREIRADIAGDAWADPTFHARVIDKMREQLGDKAAEKTAATFLDSIRELIDRVKSVLTGTTFVTADGKRLATEYVNNLERVHDAFAAAVADKFVREGYRPPGADVNTGKLLVARALELQRRKEEAAATPAHLQTPEQKIWANAKPVVAPEDASPEVKAAVAAAQKPMVKRTPEEVKNIRYVEMGVRMSPKALAENTGEYYSEMAAAMSKANDEQEALRLAKQFDARIRANRQQVAYTIPSVSEARAEAQRAVARTFPKSATKSEDTERAAVSPSEVMGAVAALDAMGDISMSPKEGWRTVDGLGGTIPTEADAQRIIDLRTKGNGTVKPSPSWAGYEFRVVPNTDGVAGYAIEARKAPDVQQSPKSDIGHKRESTTSRYVGAPDWVGSSPQQLTALRAKLAKLAKEGEVGRYWYEKSARAVMKFVGDDKAQAERFIGLLAIFSQGTALSTNTTFALQAWYQHGAGVPVRAGRFPESQSGKAQAWLDNGEDYGGIKVNNFYTDLMEEIDPSKVDHTHATMDMWMALAFDYGSRVLDQGPKYGFALREVEALAKKMGWRPHQVQAAIWTAMRARVLENEKKYKAREMALKIRERKPNGTPGDVIEGREYDHFRTVHRVALASEITQAQIDAHNEDYDTELAARTAQMSWEAEPGRSSGLLPGLRSAPLAQKQEYLEAVIATLTGQDGTDLVAELAGVAPGRNLRGLSAWEGTIGAGVQTLLPIHTEGARGSKAVAPLPRRALDLYAALKGYVMSQDAVVWHLPVFDDAAVRHNGIDIRTQRPLTPEEMTSLYAATHAEFGTWDIAPGFTDAGARLLNFVEGLSNADFQQRMDKVILAALPDDFGGGSVTWRGFRSDGNYLSNNWQENPNGEGYQATITGSGRPDIQAGAADLRARVAAVNKQFADKYGWGSTQSGRAERAAGDGRQGRGGAEFSPKQGQLNLVGVHYSAEPREAINGSYFGTGMKGAEVERVRAAKDDRLKTRVYAYASTGSGVYPEKYVGGQAHVVQLPNLYDADSNPLNLLGADNTAFETAVLDAGFAGYVVRTKRQAVAVVLGDAASAVPAENKGVNYRGADLPATPPAVLTEKAKAVQAFMADKSLPAGEMTGANWKKLVPGVELDDAKLYYKSDVAKSLPSTYPANMAGKVAGIDMSPKSPEFKKWFGDSKVVDANGEPLVVYHGTTQAFDAFDPARVGSNFGVDSRGFFFTNRALAASRFADPETAFLARGMKPMREVKEGANIVPAYLRISNPLTLEEYTEMYYTTPAIETDNEGISVTDYFDDNREDVIRKAHEMGRDGVIFAHDGDALYVAFEPNQIKSVFNDKPTSNPDISMSPKSPEFKKWFGDSTIVNPDGSPKVMYHSTKADFKVFNQANPNRRLQAIFLAPDPAFANQFVTLGSLRGDVPEGANVMPVYVRAEKVFDYQNQRDLEAFHQYLIARGFAASAPRLVDDVASGAWEVMEDDRRVVDYLERNGFDGVYVKELGTKNLAVFSPEQIKSAVGNSGAYSRETADISMSPKFKQWSRNAPLVRRADALAYDFQTGKPFVAESLHGTNATVQGTNEANDFTDFDLEKGGSMTAAESASLGIFSTSEPQVAAEYAGNVGMGRYLGLALGSHVKEYGDNPEYQKVSREANQARKDYEAAWEANKQAQIDNFALKHPDIVKYMAEGITPQTLRKNLWSIIVASAGRSTNTAYEELGAETALNAAETRMQEADRAFNAWVLDQEDAKIPKRIMPLYVRMSNPKVYDAEGKTPGGFPLTEKIASAKREGHDGVVFKNIADPSPVAVHYVSFNAADVKSAFAKSFDETGQISQSPKIVGASTRAYTPEQQRMFANTGRTVDEKSFVDKVKAMRKDLGKKMAQGLVDQFAPLKELSPMAYMLARLSKGAAGAFEALLHHGKLRITGGAFDADMSGGFIEKVGIPLHGEMEDFLWWVAGNRAERLSAQDRERLFSKSDIAAAKSLASGQLDFDYTLANGQVTRDRAAAYADSLTKFDGFNKNALDMAEQSGLIDADARKLWDNEFYVPFYRVSEEDGGFIGAKMKNGLVRQRAFKKLKGGPEKLNADLLANTLANWAHLIDASAKNRAAKAALEAAAQMGVAVEADAATVKAMASSIGKKSATVWFSDAGVERHFLVDDPFVLTAITSLEFSGLKGPLMDALSTFKHVLTVGVTASPAFKVRNLIRDSLQAIATSPLGYNPIANVKAGIEASDHSTQTYVSALASGGLIRFGTMLEGRASDRVRQLVKAGIKDSTILNSNAKMQAMYDKYLEPAIAAYNELGNRSEEITRAALYKQLTEKGMGHAEASLMARDLMDFSLQGSWTGIRFLTQVVPFMNARMQGLYKLGRAAGEDPRRFAAVLGATAVFSIALMAAYADDDDWKKREDWDRNGFWWFKLGGVAFRIPKPFEIGAIATLAERGLEYFTDPEMTGKRLNENVMKLLGDNLSMNPVPQLVKPIVDVYANKDSFSGRPIETMGMEKLQPQYRYTAGTSMVARAASTATFGAASPVQVDHLLRGYFGWLGSFVVGAADVAVRPLTSEPSRPSGDMWKTATQNFISSLPADQSRYVSHMYDQAQELEQAYGTYQSLVKQGRREEAKEFFADNRDKIAKYRGVEQVKRAEAKLNERIRIIERSNIDLGLKQLQISAIRAQQDRVARLVN